jgi:hypothetical protein
MFQPLRCLILNAMQQPALPELPEQVIKTRRPSPITVAAASTLCGLVAAGAFSAQASGKTAPLMLAQRASVEQMARAPHEVAVLAALQAGGIIDCGYFDGARWTLRPQVGYGYHLTTRNVACPFARWFTRRYKGTDTFYPKWRCREINRYESFDIRCVSGRRVIRWVGGD